MWSRLLGVVNRLVVMERARPPVLSHVAISRLVLGYFPFKEINSSSIEEFVSYDDRNYFFRGEPLDHSLQNEYVLKVTNYNDPPEVVDGLSGITKHLHERGFKCPYPIPLAQPGSEYDNMIVLSYRQLVALEKEEVKKADIGLAKNGAVNKYCVRVLVFVSGKLLANVPKTPALLFEVGHYIGSLDKALQDYSHKEIEHRSYESWDLQTLLHCRQRLRYVRDQQKVHALERIFDGFEEHVVPVMPKLSRGIVHNDPNDLNILVQRNDESSSEYSVCGVIDFGDCVLSCHVFELSIMMAYSMLSKENPVQHVTPLLAGYLSAFPLPDTDLDCLYWGVLGRLAQSITNGEYFSQLDPSNVYLGEHAVPAWKMTTMLLEMGKSEVDKIWAEARSKAKS